MPAKTIPIIFFILGFFFFLNKNAVIVIKINEIGETNVDRVTELLDK